MQICIFRSVCTKLVDLRMNLYQEAYVERCIADLNFVPIEKNT